jgi:hypothetical protein
MIHGSPMRATVCGMVEGTRNEHHVPFGIKIPVAA